MKSVLVFVEKLCVGVVAIALVSIISTFDKWDVMHPRVAIVINVVDASGAPVESATVSTYKNNGLGSSTPFGDKAGFGGARTDATGSITLLQPLETSIREHGVSARLFWTWELGKQEPLYELRISEKGYVDSWYVLDDIYRNLGEDTPTVKVQPAQSDYSFRGSSFPHGEAVDLPLVELTARLTKE